MEKGLLSGYNIPENTNRLLGFSEENKVDISKPQGKKDPISITEKALHRIKYLLQQKDTKVVGIRIMVKQKGCFGFKYNIEYAYEERPFEARIEVDYDNGKIVILIDPKAMMFIIGTEMDYVEEKLSSGFVFKNPNEKGRCGCGESFYV